MRHHRQIPDSFFVEHPMEFDKHTDISMLRYCLGATMYMPGTKDFGEAIRTLKYPGLASLVMCFEDACKLEDVPAAEANCLNMLDRLNGWIDAGELRQQDMPLIFFRVRTVEQFKAFSAKLTPKHARLITGFNFPKFDQASGAAYYEHLQSLNQSLGDVLYGMPILESREMAFIETRASELIGVKKILDQYRHLVLNIRVGGTDFSSCFGVRRGIDYTIYDVLTVRDCLQVVLNVFSRDNEYSVSGPVWEYFRVNKSMKFENLKDISESLNRRDRVVNDAVDGLLRELLLDCANGFVGKTIIHPTHIPYVNGMLSITRELYEDALQIVSTAGGVIKSKNENKMNEIGPHRCWAEKLLMRAKAYGVIESEESYAALFAGEKA